MSSSISEQDTNLALGFNSFSVSTLSDHPILFNVSGYVQKGCITAVMGPSASGKSMLLQALSGRIQELSISGEVCIDNSIIDPKSSKNSVAYVPQEDSLIGELTAREVTTNTAIFKRAEPISQLKSDVDYLLKSLGLSHVADGIIGTLIFRGLSGGQKKRVDISSELIASPSVLLMDEPTSGLDSSIAYEVLNTIRTLVKSSNGKISVILSIHQPNKRILELFDHLLLLDNGESTFFGTIPESLEYFSRIGFPCPSGVTPTDYYLQISDSNFSYTENFDFIDSFSKSIEATNLKNMLTTALKSAVNNNQTSSKSTNIIDKVTFVTQVFTLIYRDYSLAYRDPTLYYFQTALFMGFGFVAGAVFFQMPHGIDGNFNIFPGGLLWLSLMNGWAHAFKVFHISRGDKRAIHEIANNKYSPLASFVADSLSTATLTVIFMPGAIIAYFMMGFPGNAYPFLLLNYWMTSLASEAMLSFVTKFSKNPTTSMIFCQIALCMLMVFGAGLFIPWKDCPKYWIWFQEMTLFTHSSRAALMETLNHMTFLCAHLTPDGQCVDPGSGFLYKCQSFDVMNGNNICYVSGRNILWVTQGIGEDDNYWYEFAYMCAIFVVFKIWILMLTIYPWERVLYRIMNWGASSKDLHKEKMASPHTFKKQKLTDQTIEMIDKTNNKSMPSDGKDTYAVVVDNEIGSFRKQRKQ